MGPAYASGEREDQMGLRLLLNMDPMPKCKTVSICMASAAIVIEEIKVRGQSKDNGCRRTSWEPLRPQLSPRKLLSLCLCCSRHEGDVMSPFEIWQSPIGVPRPSQHAVSSRSCACLHCIMMSVGCVRCGTVVMLVHFCVPDMADGSNILCESLHTIALS